MLNTIRTGADGCARVIKDSTHPHMHGTCILLGLNSKFIFFPVVFLVRGFLDFRFFGRLAETDAEAVHGVTRCIDQAVETIRNRHEWRMLLLTSS